LLLEILFICLQGDFCTNCGAPFLRSFITFEVLPLVEFELEPGISDAEAAALLGEDVLGSATAAAGGRGIEMVVGSRGAADAGSRRGAAAAAAGGAGGGANVLRLDDYEDEGAGGGFGALGLGRSGALEDSFAAQVGLCVEQQRTSLLAIAAAAISIARVPTCR
jgi:hypothetical protein